MILEFIMLEFIVMSFAINLFGLIGLHLVQSKIREQIRRDIYLASPSAVRKKLRVRQEYKKLTK